MGLLYWAEGHLASALAAIVSSTEPLMVALLARRFLAERVAARTIAAQVLGLCGLGLIFARRLAGEPMPGLEPLALAAVLLSAASGAAGRVLGKALVDAVPAAVLLRDVGCCLALAAALGHALLERGRPLGFDAGAVAAFLYLGLVGSAAASALYLALLRRARVSSIAYLQLVTALVGVLTGVVVGGERLGPPAALGCGAVLAGLALQLRGRSASAEQPRDAARREQRRGDGEREEGDAEEHEAADHGAPGRGTSSR
jgi:probable blue pigment (indigoidine) exporter